MDDYSISSLQESRNEWCVRLINILCPLLIEGFKSIFDESWKMCEEHDETEKYLMTYQNFLSRIPKWNATIIEEETKRIVEKSNCGYLNDLISCVHIIQLKSLTCMRVGSKQKKIDIDIPSLNDFIHKVYINCARKIYTNIYLYEKNISPLQIQKHNRELELIIREQILNSIRENIPVENILKVYLDETCEEDVQVEEKEEIISTEPIIEETENKSEENKSDENKSDENKSDENKSDENKSDNLDEKIEILPLIDDDKEESVKFNDIDNAISVDNIISEISAPKTEERLEQISNERHEARKLEEMEDDDDEEEEKIKIGEKIDLSDMDVHEIGQKKLKEPLIGLEEIEVLT
jgi:hypothetical protein